MYNLKNFIGNYNRIYKKTNLIFYVGKYVEAEGRIELPNTGFAVPCITTLLLGHGWHMSICILSVPRYIGKT